MGKLGKMAVEEGALALTQVSSSDFFIQHGNQRVRIQMFVRLNFTAAHFTLLSKSALVFTCTWKVEPMCKVVSEGCGLALFIMQQQLFPEEAVGSFRRKSLTTSKCSESVSHDTYD